ncbi:hypothetical protein BDV96DRAFT_648107 [Lophiotrema nucula]|uniref:Uncharacterized protein n=1 Tax=Lophiotrema nucula TaxID=690887 RepID=A0A6A5Z4Q1_9PLEO|nr:hypothetical protein BDV96DRAFT_648107 [Lophiotrema nucula]
MRIIDNWFLALAAWIAFVTALPTSPLLALDDGANSSLAHITVEQRYVHGWCSFTAWVKQWCDHRRTDAFSDVQFRMLNFHGDDGSPITSLHSEPSMLGDHQVTACRGDQFGDSCSLLAMHGFDDGKDMRMKGYQWTNDGGHSQRGYHFKMTFDFNGCQWDEDNSKDGYPNTCGNNCGRGPWSEGDHFCYNGSPYREHGMNCYFRC